MSKTTHLKVVLLSLAHSMFKLAKKMISKEQSILKAKIECGWKKFSSWESSLSLLNWERVCDNFDNLWKFEAIDKMAQ